MSITNINDEWDNFISNDYIDDDMIDELDKDIYENYDISVLMSKDII